MQKGGKNIGNGYISSPLCATSPTFHPISVPPLAAPPPHPLSLCLLSLAPLFLLCTPRLNVRSRNALIAFFTKSSDFSCSRGECRSAAAAAAVVVECGDISKAPFSCRYLAPASPFYPPPAFPNNPPGSSHPSMQQRCYGVMRGQRMGGKNNQWCISAFW